MMIITPATLKEVLNGAEAHRITVAAHVAVVANPANPDILVNHWCMYVKLPNKVHGQFLSVRIDMTANSLATDGKVDKSGTLGALHVDGLLYVVSNHVVKSFDLAPLNNVTVVDLLNAIESAGFQNYDLNHIGIGCRFWTKTVLERFEELRFVQGVHAQFGYFDETWDVEGNSLGAERSMAVQSGTFHTPTSNKPFEEDDDVEDEGDEVLDL
jgi:hypothetical protein